MTKMQQAHILFPFICFEWSCICHSTAVSLRYITPNARNSNKADRALKLQMMVLPFVLGSTLRLTLSPIPPNGESHRPSSTALAMVLRLRPIPVPTKTATLCEVAEGIFRLHVGCAKTQWTSGIFSPVPQGLG